jgi:Glucose / Sorbosone dehydrogenase
VHVAAPPGDARLFVVEKAGRVVQPGGAEFLNITSLVEDTGERGLLSIAFAPDYATTGLFYVFYTAADGDLTIREGTRSATDPNRGELGRTLFTVEHSSRTNHNGGQLAFGPDGALYASTGDGAATPANAQDPASLLGKILRIEPRTQTAPTVWALGLRNPWRFSFDRATGDMLIGDVGAGAREEIDFAPAGAAGRNYGWPACEGNPPGGCSLPGAVPAALSLDRGNDEYTGVIGGFVVRDPGLPTLQGRYVFGDLSKSTVMSAVVDAAGGRDLRAEPGLPVTAAASFGEDGCGHVYVASLNGPVYRVHDGPAAPCPATPGAPPPGSTTADRTPCTLRARPARRVQRIVRRGGRLRVRLRANEACTATLRARRFRTRRVGLRANAVRTVRLRPTARGLRKLRAALERSHRGRLRVAVRVRARDAAGNPSSVRVRPRIN